MAGRQIRWINIPYSFRGLPSSVDEILGYLASEYQRGGTTAAAD